MNVPACPYCTTRVTPDHSACPRCGRELQSVAFDAKPAAAAAPEMAWMGSSLGPSEPIRGPFVDPHFAAGERGAWKADGPFNPYQSPAAIAAGAERLAELPLKRGWLWLLFSFEGRIPRRTYWGAYFGLVALYALFLVLHLLLPLEGEALNFVTIALVLAFGPPIIWAYLAISVKRWHDHDKSGWWLLVSLIPYIGGLWIFIELGCLRGSHGRNRYGLDPT